MSNDKSSSECTIKTTDVESEKFNHCEVAESQLLRQSRESISASKADHWVLATVKVSNFVRGIMPDNYSALDGQNKQERRHAEAPDVPREDGHNESIDDRNGGTAAGADKESGSSESETHESDTSDSDNNRRNSNENDSSSSGGSENQEEVARDSDDESHRHSKRRRLNSPSRHSPDSLSASEDSEVEAYFECVRLRTSIVESARRGFRHRASLRNYGFRMQRLLARQRVQVNESSGESEKTD